MGSTLSSSVSNKQIGLKKPLYSCSASGGAHKIKLVAFSKICDRYADTYGKDQMKKIKTEILALLPDSTTHVFSATCVGTDSTKYWVICIKCYEHDKIAVCDYESESGVMYTTNAILNDVIQTILAEMQNKGKIFIDSVSNKVTLV